MSNILSFIYRNLKNVKNVKILYQYKSEIKEIIKINNSKIKVIDNLINEYNTKIEKYEKNVKKIMKNHAKYKKFVCEHCALKTLTKKDLEKHKCGFTYFRSVPGRYDNPVFDHKLHEILIELNDLKFTNNEKIRSVNQLRKSVKKLNSEINEIDDIIKDLLLVCQKCKKKNLYLEECGCSYNHILCNECFTDINKCPLCSEILNLELCPICLEHKKKIIDIKCGNHHKICKKCMNSIIDTNPKCPFCRIKINNIL